MFGQSSEAVAQARTMVESFLGPQDAFGHDGGRRRERFGDRGDRGDHMQNSMPSESFTPRGPALEPNQQYDANVVDVRESTFVVEIKGIRITVMRRHLPLGRVISGTCNMG